jgi:hypothetical protein
MKDQIKTFRYNAGKVDAVKRAVTFGLLTLVMAYSFFKGGLVWDKNKVFIIAFFLFAFFIIMVSIAGCKKEKMRLLTPWKYRLYNNFNSIGYFTIRGALSALLFTGLFALLTFKNMGIEGITQKGNFFIIAFFGLMPLFGLYHLLVIRYIIRTGTVVHNEK